MGAAPDVGAAPQSHLCPETSGTGLNVSEFLLQEHNADPEREPPGERSRTCQPTLRAANSC